MSESQHDFDIQVESEAHRAHRRKKRHHRNKLVKKLVVVLLIISAWGVAFLLWHFMVQNGPARSHSAHASSLKSA